MNTTTNRASRFCSPCICSQQLSAHGSVESQNIESLIGGNHENAVIRCRRVCCFACWTGDCRRPSREGAAYCACRAVVDRILCRRKCRRQLRFGYGNAECDFHLDGSWCERTPEQHHAAGPEGLARGRAAWLQLASVVVLRPRPRGRLAMDFAEGDLNQLHVHLPVLPSSAPVRMVSAGVRHPRKS